MIPRFEILSAESFGRLYNRRDYGLIDPANRDAIREDFEERFFSLLTEVENLASEYELDGQYYLHEGHNWSHFLDMAFETESYLDSSFFRRLWELICRQSDDWMICVWGVAYLFLTKDRILVYQLEEDFGDLLKLNEELQR